MPKPANSQVARREGPPTILFTVSALARKGVLELVDALQHLPVGVVAPPGAAESYSVWGAIDIETIASIDAGMARADLVVLPAWVEHQPRSLLAAMARGIPVIATAACGLPLSPQWICVPERDVGALRDAIMQRLALPQLHRHA